MLQDHGKARYKWTVEYSDKGNMAKHTWKYYCVYFLKDRALDYLSTCIDQVQTFGDILQLVIVELIYKVQEILFAVKEGNIKCVNSLVHKLSW